MRITVGGQREVRHAAQVLRHSRGTVRRELAQAFRTAGEQTLGEVKRNVEAMPMRGFRVRRRGEKIRKFRGRMPGTGIRSRISRVTELDVSAGAGDPRARFAVHAGQLGRARKLPGYFDRGEKFRHPILGKRKAWAAQQGKPWFRKTILRNVKVFHTECTAALGRAIATIRQEL